MRLNLLGPRIATANTSRLSVAPKTCAPIYQTPEYKQWREAVIAAAGRRCQAMTHGVRCQKAEPRHRMFADHIIELQDKGNPFDPANGQCLCGSHHTSKTAQARAKRMRS